MAGLIYYITSKATGRVYVGSTTRSAKQRWAEHMHYLRKGTQTGQLLPRPDPAWLKTVPRAFRDTIALRAARFEGKKLEPAARPAPSYAALAPWLTAEPALRREFPRRLATLAREPAFRAALIQNLVAHPEWEPLLFPERFLKPASAPTGVRP